MLRTVSVLLAGTMLAGGAAQAEEFVNVYNWSDYIDDALIEEFQQETGITVRYDVFDNQEIVESKLMVGGSGYDVVVVTAEPHLSRLIEAQALAKLDKDKLAAAKAMDPDLVKQIEISDPGMQHSLIYLYGTLGLGINLDKVAERIPDAPLNSWELIFNPEYASKLEDCGISFLDSPVDVVPVALHYLGLNPSSQDEGDLAKAEELLKSVRPNVRYYHSSRYISDLASGDLCLAFGYSTDILQARERAKESGNGVKVRYIVPEEGTQLGFNTFTIPRDAQNVDAAYKFIDFVLRPQNIARISNRLLDPNGVPAAAEFMDAEMRNDPAVFPPAEVRAKYFVSESVTQQYDRLRTRAWTRVVTGR